MLKWFKGEQAQRGKGEPDLQASIQIGLLLPDEDLLKGQVAHANMHGADLYFADGNCPDCQLDDRVRLKLVIEAHREALTIDAVVKELSIRNETALYRFQFLYPDRLSRELPPTLLSYLNRRRAIRVEPDEIVPVGIIGEKIRESIIGWLIDISRTGIGISVEPEKFKKIGTPSWMVLSLELPGSQFPLRLSGDVLYHAPCGRNVRYGIRINWGHTSNRLKQESVISRYVLQRQHAMLQGHPPHP